MFSFLTDSSFWILVTPFIIGVFIETFISWSAPILDKHPNALFWNNTYIICLIGFLVFICIKRGFGQGVAAFVLAFVAYAIAGKIIERRKINSIIRNAKKI